MNYLRLISYILLSAVIAWIGFFVVLFRIDPETSFGVLLFFVSLFVALACSLSIVGFFLRKAFVKGELLYEQLNVSIRQGILLSGLAIGCLFFQHLKVLTWWLGILMIGIVVLIEFYLVAKE